MLYLKLDKDGYLLSVSRKPTAGPAVESLEDFDLSGHRIEAHRWDGEQLVLDEDKLATLEAEDAAAKAEEAKAVARATAMQEVQEVMVLAQLTAADDTTALRWRALYPVWAPGVAYAAGDKVRRGDKLYRCRQSHTSQADWPPETTPSLWAEICEAHAGTQADPIPYSGNMALEAGKYYTQDGKVYRCTQDTVNPVYHTLADLVGLYVEVVTA